MSDNEDAAKLMSRAMDANEVCCSEDDSSASNDGDDISMPNAEDAIIELDKDKDKDVPNEEDHTLVQPGQQQPLEDENERKTRIRAALQRANLEIYKAGDDSVCSYNTHPEVELPDWYLASDEDSDDEEFLACLRHAGHTRDEGSEAEMARNMRRRDRRQLNALADRAHERLARGFPYGY
jgi:hypothetical protein